MFQKPLILAKYQEGNFHKLLGGILKEAGFKRDEYNIPSLNEQQHLKAIIERDKPNVVIVLDEYFFELLCGVRGIGRNRGAIIESTLIKGLKVIPTHSPSDINRHWAWLFTTIMDFRKVLRHCHYPQLPTDNRQLKVNVTATEFIKYCDFLINDPTVPYYSFDIETTTEPEPHITWFGIGHSKDFALNIQLLKEERGEFKSKVSALNLYDEVKVWQAIAKVLASDKGAIAQNISFEESILWKNHNIKVNKRKMDTMIAAHVCWPSQPKDLGFLTSLCTDRGKWKSMSKTDMGTYNALDVVNTYELFEFFEDELDVMRVRHTFDFEIALLDVSLMFEKQGLNVDVELMETRKDEFIQKRKEIKDKILELTGMDINLNSTKQMKVLLYDKCGLPTQYKRRSKGETVRKVTTDAETLERLDRETNHPVLKLVLQYRKVNKIITNYLSFPVSSEGKIHTSYNVTGTDTGRWSSSKSIAFNYGPGNLQNVPESQRDIYVADDGCVIVAGDLVQAEAVVVAYLSGNRPLIKMFADGADVHRHMGATMFNKPFDQITEHERYIGKRLNHAGNYDAGAGVIAASVGCTYKEAVNLKELYRRANPLLEIWHKSIQLQLQNGMTLTTPHPFNRKRTFYERWSDILFRSAYAQIPQSTIGDLMNQGLLDFYTAYGDYYKILLQLHDAMYVQVSDDWDEILTCVERMDKSMKIPILINNEEIIIDVDYKVGKNWGKMATLGTLEQIKKSTATSLSSYLNEKNS